MTWLCDAFGLVGRWVAGDHRAPLAVGDAAVVVMTADGADRSLPRVPGATHAVVVGVEDVDASFARTRAASARILAAPATHPYGERQYSAEDLAGHRWTFSQTAADVAPEDWGGRSCAAE